MLKRVLTCAIASVLVVSSYSASAAFYKGDIVPVASTPIQPYVGINYVYYHNSYKSSVTDTIAGVLRTVNPNATSPNDWSGASLDTGFKYGQYMGLEFGYFQTSNKSRNTVVAGTPITVSELQKGFYTQLMGYWPIQNWDLIGIAGASVNSLGDSTVTFGNAKTGIQTDDSVRPLLGIGADYHFNKNIGARLTARYSFVQSNYVNNATIWDAGLFYAFN